MTRLTPTLHKDVPLQTRVRVDAQYLGKEVTGTVAGIASIHVIFHYIVILDQPHTRGRNVHRNHCDRLSPDG